MPSTNNQNKQSNLSKKSPSAAASASLHRCRNFPITPRVPKSKCNNITLSPSSSPSPTAFQSSSNEIDSINIQTALSDALEVNKNLSDQVAKFESVLRRLEQGYKILQTRVETLEKEANESKQQNQLLESRISFLEEENGRLFDRVNAICESTETTTATVPNVSANPSPCTARLQDEIDLLKQSSRNKEIILSGAHIENRIKNELDRRHRPIPLRALCVDIIAKIPGLENCDLNIEQCIRLDGDHPKLLIKLFSDYYRSKIFSRFFSMRHKKPFYINENLIPARAKLFHEIRMLKKNKKDFIHSTFTKRGEIYYCLHESKNTMHKLTPETLTSLKEISVTYEDNIINNN